MNDGRSTDARAPRPEPVTLACADGQRLQGHFFAARGDLPAAPVLISPATGVRQHFYWRFADWLAAQGHAALVFDYRGIGHLDWFRQSHQALWPLMRRAVLGDFALEAPGAR